MNAQNLPVVGPNSPLPQVGATMDLVRAALATGNIDIYREAVGLAKELDQIAALKAFNNAMADAKAAMPTIRRNREVNSGGRGPAYKFEDLAEIARTIDPILSECGLNYRWRVSNKPGEPINVVCVVSHRAGHFEETSLSAPPDNGPGRNVIQQIGSTVTYLQRYTLKSALGLAVSHDDDGRQGIDNPAPANDPAPPYTPPAGSISPAQAAELRMMLEDIGASERAFTAWAKVTRLEAIPDYRFDSCKEAILKKKG